MPDVFTKRKRSEVMSRIRGRGNKDTEIAFAKLMRRCHITGWRRQVVLRMVGRAKGEAGSVERGAGGVEGRREKREGGSVEQGAGSGRKTARRQTGRMPVPPGNDGKRRATPKAFGATNVAVDFIFPRQRVAIFVDGCFWHGCPIHSNPRKWLKRSSMGAETMVDGRWEMRARNQRRGRETCAEREPRGDSAGAPTGVASPSRTSPSQVKVRTGKAFWAKKLAGNMARDRLVNRTLRQQGWRVIRIWEHELNAGSGTRGAKAIQRIRRALDAGS